METTTYFHIKTLSETGLLVYQAHQRNERFHTFIWILRRGETQQRSADGTIEMSPGHPESVLRAHRQSLPVSQGFSSAGSLLFGVAHLNYHPSVHGLIGPVLIILCLHGSELSPILFSTSGELQLVSLISDPTTFRGSPHLYQRSVSACSEALFSHSQPFCKTNTHANTHACPQTHTHARTHVYIYMCTRIYMQLANLFTIQ